MPGAEKATQLRHQGDLGDYLKMSLFDPTLLGEHLQLIADRELLMSAQRELIAEVSSRTYQAYENPEPTPVYYDHPFRHDPSLVLLKSSTDSLADISLDTADLLYRRAVYAHVAFTLSIPPPTTKEEVIKFEKEYLTKDLHVAILADDGQNCTVFSCILDSIEYQVINSDPQQIATRQWYVNIIPVEQVDLPEIPALEPTPEPNSEFPILLPFMQFDQKEWTRVFGQEYLDLLPQIPDGQVAIFDYNYPPDGSYMQLDLFICDPDTGFATQHLVFISTGGEPELTTHERYTNLDVLEYVHPLTEERFQVVEILTLTEKDEEQTLTKSIVVPNPDLTLLRTIDNQIETRVYDREGKGWSWVEQRRYLEHPDWVIYERTDGDEMKIVGQIKDYPSSLGPAEVIKSFQVA